MAGPTAVEDLGDPPRRLRRVRVYRVADGRLRERWLYDEDQRFVEDCGRFNRPVREPRTTAQRWA